MTTPDPTPARMAGPCSNCIALRDELTDTRTQADLAIETMNELFAERETLTCDLAAARAERDEARRAAANNAAWGQAWEADALKAQAALERASVALRFYAREESYQPFWDEPRDDYTSDIDVDYGDRARAALASRPNAE